MLRAIGTPTAVVVVAGLVLVGCGSVSETSPGATHATSTAAHADDFVDPTQELVGHGILMQDTPGAPVELCLGGVAESYPPQCGGPALKGNFSWEQVTSQTVGETTWTDTPYWVVGLYAPDDGEQGSITVTRPLSQNPPAEYPVSAPVPTEFPQLCADPTADVPDVDQTARTQGPTAMVEEQALMELFQSLDGYVASWVSEGGPTFNVVVNGDPERARKSIREVFTGPLCIEQRALPAEDQVRAAQEALAARDDLRLTAMMSGVAGVLEVDVVVADRTTVEAIRETVAPWLTPEEVVVRGALQPLRRS